MNKTSITLALLLAGAATGACYRRVYVTPRAYEPVYVQQQPTYVVAQPPPAVEPQPVYVGQAEAQPPPPAVEPTIAPPPAAVEAQVVVAPPPAQATVVVAAPPPAAQPQVVYVEERRGWVPPHLRHRRQVIVVH